VIVVNGTVADIYSTLSADPNVIRELDYTITVPTGSLIGATTLTLGIGFPEKVSYVFSAAQPWGSLSVSASVVQAGTTPFPVQVHVTSLLSSGTATGTSAATLTVQVKPLLML
jgi:hypothetical protein